ncbi:MAG: type VII toxin-antitoxin system MntA family adenylyltransferase antitoxin [Candidatus Binatia bacterium]
MKHHYRPIEKESLFAAGILAEVQRIARETLTENEVVYLFGSWARGEATPCSDIDLAVESRTTLPPGLLARLRERLEESHIPYRVDVVDLQKADAAFRQRVLAEGIVWSD